MTATVETFDPLAVAVSLTSDQARIVRAYANRRQIPDICAATGFDHAFVSRVVVDILHVSRVQAASVIRDYDDLAAGRKRPPKRRYAEVPTKDESTPAYVPVLTARERAVVELLAAGRAQGAIAEALGITLHQARKHIRRLLSQFAVAHQKDIAGRARGLGLIPPTPEKTPRPVPAGKPRNFLAPRPPGKPRRQWSHCQSRAAKAAGISAVCVDVIQLLAEGLTDDAICARLDITQPVLAKRVGRILTALDVDTRLRAMTVGMRLGLIDLHTNRRVKHTPFNDEDVRLVHFAAARLNNTAIAERMGWPVGMVGRRLVALYHKLGTVERRTAVETAARLGLIGAVNL